MLINAWNWLLAGFTAKMAIAPVEETPAVRSGRGRPDDQGTPGGRWLRARLCKCSLLDALILGALATSLLVMGEPRLAAARPDLPVINGDTATCTGDQHLGIASGIDFLTPPILNLYVNSLTTDITPDNGVAGISMQQQGANGSNGSSHAGYGDGGGNGAAGQNLTVNFDGGSHAITTQGDIAAGILVQSAGGSGGNGGDALVAGTGGNGGNGANGGTLAVTSTGLITTSGSQAHGILAASQGGNGGNGGDATGVAGIGGDGGVGGTAGMVTVTSHGDITTFGVQAQGIAAQSLGGAGGDGGSGGGIVGQGGAALGSGPGGKVEVT